MIRHPLWAIRRRILTARSQREGGAVLVLTAISATALVVMTSLAVDIGRLSARNRDLQKVADLVSLDLVRSLDGSNAATLANSSTFWAAAASSSGRNDLPVSCATNVTVNSFKCSGAGKTTLTVTLGKWAGAFHAATSATDVPTAVQVQAGDTVGFFFAAHHQSTDRGAVAGKDKTASFGLGSSLATLSTDNSPVLAPLLNGLLGGGVNLGLVDYQGIAGANINLLDLSNALGSELGLSAGSVDQVLDSDVTVGQVMNAAISALQNQGDPTATAAATVLRQQILAQMDASPILNQKIKLGDVLDLGTDTTSAAAAADINTLDLLNLISTAGQAAIADGNHTVDLNLNGVSVDLGGGLNLSTLQTHLTVIEPPQFKYDAHVLDQVHTAQIGITVTAAQAVIDTGNATLVTQILGPLGDLVLGLLGPLGLANVHVGVGPVTVSSGAAQGTATLRSIECPTGANPGFTLGVSTSGAGVTADIPLDIRLKALLNLLNIQVVSGSLSTSQNVVDPTSETPVSFSFPPDAPGTAKDTGPGSLLAPASAVTSDLKVLGLPLGTIVAGLLAPTGLVTKLLNGIETAVIHPLEKALGLEIASGTAFAGLANPVVRCTGPKLLQ